MKGEGQKLDWIQALRGIAALMVVLVHSRFILEASPAGKAIADNVMLPMAMGVDLFFLISGFLMVLTTESFDGSKTYAWQFLAKRIARVWPIYVIVSIIVIPLEHHGLHGFHDLSLWRSMLEGVFFIPHDPIASAMYFNMLVDVSWTLCFEFYFYLVFAGSMLFGKYRYLAMAAWFALTLIVSPIVRGSHDIYAFSQPPILWSRYANLAVNPIIWDFVLGMLAAWAYKSRLVIRSSAVIYGAMAVLIGGLASHWTAWGFSNFHGPAGWGASLAILFLGIVLLSKLGEIRVPAWSIWLGSISYSLYLTHLYVFNLTQRLLAHTSISAESALPALFIFRPVLAIVAAGLIFRFIENPTSIWLRNVLLRRSTTHPIVAVEATPEQLAPGPSDEAHVRAAYGGSERQTAASG